MTSKDDLSQDAQDESVNISADEPETDAAEWQAREGVESEAADGKADQNESDRTDSAQTDTSRTDSSRTDSAQTDTAPEQTAVWVPALKEAAWAFLAAAILLDTVYFIWFFKFHPEFERFAHRGDVPTIAITGNQFVPVRVGTGGYKDGAAVVAEYFEGSAILEVKRPFVAEDYPFIKFDIEGLTT